MSEKISLDSSGTEHKKILVGGIIQQMALHSWHML